MYKTLNDIESYEQKVDKLLNEAELSRSGLFDIHKIGAKIGLNQEEIETMHYHLTRSNMVEPVKDSLLRISKYGCLIHSGKITQAYAPI